MLQLADLLLQDCCVVLVADVSCQRMLHLLALNVVQLRSHDTTSYGPLQAPRNTHPPADDLQHSDSQHRHLLSQHTWAFWVASKRFASDFALRVRSTACRCQGQISKTPGSMALLQVSQVPTICKHARPGM